MDDFGLRPEPPLWALEGGLPAPQKGETFIPYVRRLGLKPSPLLAGLNRRTISCANMRLATALQKCMQPTFDHYVDGLARKHLTPERRRWVENLAYNIFGDAHRQRPIS